MTKTKTNQICQVEKCGKPAKSIYKLDNLTDDRENKVIPGIVLKIPLCRPHGNKIAKMGTWDNEVSDL